MKCLYWNIIGLANVPTRLVLKKFLTIQKPDFRFLSEPLIPYDKFPRRFLNNLGLKLLVVNNRPNLIPNILCICDKSMNPQIILVTDHLVSLKIDQDAKSFYIVVVYASTCPKKWKDLWKDLYMQKKYLFLSLGDF